MLLQLHCCSLRASFLPKKCSCRRSSAQRADLCSTEAARRRLRPPCRRLWNPRVAQTALVRAPGRICCMELYVESLVKNKQAARVLGEPHVRRSFTRWVALRNARPVCVFRRWGARKTATGLETASVTRLTGGPCGSQFRSRGSGLARSPTVGGRQTSVVVGAAPNRPHVCVFLCGWFWVGYSPVMRKKPSAWRTLRSGHRSPRHEG